CQGAGEVIDGGQDTAPQRGLAGRREAVRGVLDRLLLVEAEIHHLCGVVWLSATTPETSQRETVAVSGVQRSRTHRVPDRLERIGGSFAGCGIQRRIDEKLRPVIRGE